MRYSKVKSTDVIPSSYTGGKRPGEFDASGERSGTVYGSDGNPVAGILVGCLYIPTRNIVGHTVSDSEGKYSFPGLLNEPDNYLCFAYPDAKLLDGEYRFATRWKST